jgi:hypothetical protein
VWWIEVLGELANCQWAITAKFAGRGTNIVDGDFLLRFLVDLGHLLNWDFL